MALPMPAADPPTSAQEQGATIESAAAAPPSATATLATLDIEAAAGGRDSAEEKDETEPEKGAASAVEEAPSVPAPPYFPNGGRRAYRTTAGGVLVLFSSFGLSNSYAAFQSHFQTVLLPEYSPSEISWFGSVHLFILFAMGLFSGRLFDQGYFRYQLALGSALWVGGMFALSASKTYGQVFASFGICLGVALGTMFSPTLSCVGSYFSTRRTLMMGCTAGGAAAGATIFPIIANNLFRTHGFAYGVRALAYIHLGCLVLANVLMRPRNDLPPQKPPPVVPLVRSFLKQPQTWFASVGCAFVMWGMFIPIFYIQVFAQDHNAAPVVVNYGLSILNASATVTRLTVGFLADQYGNLTCALPVTALIGGMIFAMLGATSTGGAIAFCVVFGMASGAWVTIMAPSLISLSSTVREFGVRSGLGFIFVSLACLSGSPIAGAILRSTGTGDNYLGVCIFGGCATLVGTGLLAAARRWQVRRRGTWKV
ncbi:hypothetical protein JCM6882_005923 [Rhodosporidiobolus microsporus]